MRKCLHTISVFFLEIVILPNVIKFVHIHPSCGPKVVFSQDMSLVS